ncbi:MAG: V-type ATP synthase subunit E [Clostridia bacterium]|nr:V-type ATP synthase subunit E [Clostridia bacterium]
MLNQNDKLERFAAQINRTAEKSIQKIEKQTEKLSSTALSTFREEAQQELNAQKTYADTRLERESNHALAQKAAELKKKAADHREALVSRVYAEAEAQLCAFVRTPAYRALLQDCIVALSRAFPQGGVRVFVRAEDEAAAKEICGAIDGVSEVCVSNEIKLGLAFAENTDGTVHVEDTFESRLAADRARFLATCKLSILP